MATSKNLMLKTIKFAFFSGDLDKLDEMAYILDCSSVEMVHYLILNAYCGRQTFGSADFRELNDKQIEVMRKEALKLLGRINV